MPTKRKRGWALFGNHGVRRALDLSKVCVVELSSVAAPGVPDPPQRLLLYFGDGPSPITVSDPEDIKALLTALDLEGLGDA
jgi:hypothetical protein